MKAIRILQETAEFDWPEDVATIVETFREHGLICTPQQANDLWRKFSESYSAGWLILPENHDIVAMLRSYFEEVESTEASE